MISLPSIIIIIGSLGSLGLLAGGMGYLISQFKSGSSEQKKDVLSSASEATNFWKEQADSFKAMAVQEKEAAAIKDKDWNIKFTELSREVGEIKGQLFEKEKQAQQYLEILQNRDPEMKQFMQYMVQSVKDQTESQQKIVEVLNDIHVMTKAEHDRDLSITSTISKT